MTAAATPSPNSRHSDETIAAVKHCWHGRGAAAFEVLGAGSRWSASARTDHAQDWVTALEDAGLEVAADRNGPPGRREALRLRCEKSYRAALSARTDLLDLAMLVQVCPRFRWTTYFRIGSSIGPR